MIKELADLQDRAFSKNPIKSKARKRHVSGMKEVKKYLVMNKVKMVIISPDLEKLRMQGKLFLKLLLISVN